MNHCIFLIFSQIDESDEESDEIEARKWPFLYGADQGQSSSSIPKKLPTDDGQEDEKRSESQTKM